MKQNSTSTTKGVTGANSQGRDSKRLLLSILFFLSGATSLGYEVVWFKRFANVWGSSALAMALVVGSVLLGLGLGAFLIGRRTRIIANPIQWYAIFELLIGVCALLVPMGAGLLGGLNTWLTSAAGGSPILLTLFRGFLTFLVLGVPTVLMGGTLPLLVKSLSSGTEEPGTTAAWMYGINTAGAAVGCLLTGFWIVPMLGLMWTNIAVACVNFVIAGIAYTNARDEEPTTPSIAKASAMSVASQAASSGYLLILIAAALAGFASLGLQMIWARQLAVMLGGSTYASLSSSPASDWELLCLNVCAPAGRIFPASPLSSLECSSSRRSLAKLFCPRPPGWSQWSNRCAARTR
jgi:spermidine synthase